MQGLGYQDYIIMRHINEGLLTSKLEDPGNERHIVYFARSHIIDHETQQIARGPLKIGRAKFATAIMRARNQPGVDFRIYSEIIFKTEKQTFIVENIIKDACGHRRILMSQGQLECYNIFDNEIKDTIKNILAISKAEKGIIPVSVHYYYNGKWDKILPPEYIKSLYGE